MFVIVAFARGRYFCSTASTPKTRKSASLRTCSLVCHGLMLWDQALSDASLLGILEDQDAIGGGAPSMAVALL
jgi:hypothetical protein